MGDAIEAREDRRVAVMPGPDATRLAETLAALGWTAIEGEAPVVIVDLAAGDVEAGTARRDRSAVLALSPLTGAAAGRQAFAAGATHWLGADHGPEDLRVALDLAARYARRVGGQPLRGRRAEDPTRSSRGTLERWLAARRGAAGVIVVRLSRFEFVNAAFGRTGGDGLIAAAEARIEAWAETLDVDAVRQRDGADFIVALAAAGGALTDAAHRLETALAAPFAEGGTSVSLGTRIGVAAVEPGGTIAHAVAAARRVIGARVVDPEPRLDRLAADLHRALDRDEIAVRFQPQVVVATGAIVGVEALARWHHPGLGELGAEALFAAAERAGLGLALSEHIQRRAFEEAARWDEPLAPLRLSINVTAADLARAGFAESFLDRIAAAGLARGRVTAEIVETELVDDLEDAAAILARLRGAGLRVAIDDFGTGYSSLAYLKMLPVDYLKIDRSLTRDIAGSERDRAVVRGVIAIARSLGMWTIAEGVEIEAERALLAAEGCDLYQGFLCAEPLDTAALSRLIGAR